MSAELYLRASLLLLNGNCYSNGPAQTPKRPGDKEKLEEKLRITTQSLRRRSKERETESKHRRSDTKEKKRKSHQERSKRRHGKRANDVKERKQGATKERKQSATNTAIQRHRNQVHNSIGPANQERVCVRKGYIT